jgi:hypothetical protein
MVAKLLIPGMLEAPEGLFGPWGGYGYEGEKAGCGKRVVKLFGFRGLAGRRSEAVR